MSKFVLTSCTMNMICNTNVNCPGCEKLFPARQARAQIHYRVDYHVLCIEECEGYKKLELIAECKNATASFSQILTSIITEYFCLAYGD